MPPLEDCNCICASELQDSCSWETLLSSDTEQVPCILSRCPSFMTLTVFVPLTWDGSRTFSCVFMSLCPTINLEGFFVFLENMLSKTALQNRIYGKLAQLNQRKLLSGFCCHLLLSMLLFWPEWCASGILLATIYLQKYWVFSKKIQSYPSALQLFGFDSNFSLSMQEAETTTQFACAVLEGKLVVCRSSSLSSCQPWQAGNRPEIWELWGNSPF